MPEFSALSLIDLAEGIRLTGGSEPLYLRLLPRFPGDDSAALLKRALEDGDVCAAFMAAHTLKGLTAQLALSALNAHAARQCDLLRWEAPSALPAARAALPALLTVHQKTLAAIEDLTRKTPCNP